MQTISVRHTARWIALMLMALPCFAMSAEEKIIEKIIIVHGEAVSKVTPDQAKITVTVRAEDEALNAAKQKHDEKLRSVLSLAKERHVAERDMQTNLLLVNPLYNYDSKTSKQILRGYQVESSITFTFTDFLVITKFINDVVDLGIDQIGGIEYGLKDEKEFKNNALKEAVAAAYAKATLMASAAGVVVDKPIVIDETEAQITRPFPRYPMPSAMAMSGDSAAPPQLPAGQIEIRQSVTITYQIK